MSTPTTSLTDTPLRFSIVIPTFNEEEDIAETLESLLQLDYPNYEVLVVDESRDRTPEIVQGYAGRGVRYVRQTRSTGRSAGRNQGILEANGEVVVILNADVSLPSDFLARLAEHYRAGADYVLVESAVSNTTALFPRYAQALHEYYYGPDTTVNMNWTEGFSCRRAAAIAVGLIPEGQVVPLVAGEDGWFGERLQAAGYKKVFDRSILVTHVVPQRLRPFWRQRVGRGHGVGQVWMLRHGITRGELLRRALIQTVIVLATSTTVLPMLRWGWRYCQHSPRRWADLLPFTFAYYLESWANLAGIWYSFLEFRRAGISGPLPIPA